MILESWRYRTRDVTCRGRIVNRVALLIDSRSLADIEGAPGYRVTENVLNKGVRVIECKHVCSREVILESVGYKDVKRSKCKSIDI